ncbi:MAG: hypothetical protein ILO10_07935 [Kiritimatiellae bacterium]|nr:hypothetical protein [Kiritimatiellia bacterium]
MRPIFSKNVSTDFVKKLLSQRKRLSIIDNLYARAGRKPILSEAQREQMQQHVQAHPGATLDEIRRACCLRCCLATVDNTLRRMGLTNKNRRCGPPRPGPRPPCTGHPQGVQPRHPTGRRLRVRLVWLHFFLEPL